MNRGWRHTLGIFSVLGNTQVCLPTSASWSPCLLTQGGLDEGSIHHIPDTSLGGAVLLSNLDNQRHLGPCVPLVQAFFTATMHCSSAHQLSGTICPFGSLKFIFIWLHIAYNLNYLTVVWSLVSLDCCEPLETTVLFITLYNSIQLYKHCYIL